MSNAVQIIDEIWGRGDGRRRRDGPLLRIVAETATASEVIAARVRDEWAKTQETKQAGFETRQNLVHWLSGGDYQLPDTCDRAVQDALNAFSNGAFLFFWNDEQIELADQRLNMFGENEAVFLQLFPMKGG